MTDSCVRSPTPNDPDWLDYIERRVRTSRSEQGLTATVSDPVVLNRIAELLRSVKI